MKALLVLQGAPDVPLSHDLEAIFMELSGPTRRAIEEWWDTECQPHIEKLRSDVEGGGFMPPRTIGEALRQAANAFVEWRYGEGEDELYSLAWLPGALRQLVLRERPDLAPIEDDQCDTRATRQ